MIDLDELRQLISFEELGTLKAVGDKFHISTPSISRSMQNLEKSFGVCLFKRGKNKIQLNETGHIAASIARDVIRNTENAMRKVKDFDERQHTIVIKSCAPAPLWVHQREINIEHPCMTISSAICQNDEVMAAWEEGQADIAILPFKFDGAREFMQENLYVCVPYEHELASRKELAFDDINGFNFLLRTELGFWDTLCREKMPSSKFLVQSDPDVFDELVKASSLPCFTTDYSQSPTYPNRISIPLSDLDARVTFYLADRKKN